MSFAFCISPTMPRSSPTSRKLTRLAASQPEQMSAHVINLRGLSYAHFPDEHTAIRDYPDQITFLQTPARLANRAAADIQHLRQLAFVNAITRLQFSANYHPFQFLCNQRTK